MQSRMSYMKELEKSIAGVKLRKKYRRKDEGVCVFRRFNSIKKSESLFVVFKA